VSPYIEKKIIHLRVNTDLTDYDIADKLKLSRSTVIKFLRLQTDLPPSDEELGCNATPGFMNYLKERGYDV
jgi:transcriptional regulator with XRE-family HTH domain